MIYIDVTEDKWKEFEEYHSAYIEKTVPANWESFLRNEKIKRRDKVLLFKVLKKQGIKIPRVRDKKKKEKLKSLINFCISDDIDFLAKVTKDQLFDTIREKDEKGEEIDVDEKRKKKCVGYIITVFGYKKFSDATNIKSKDGQPWNRHTFMSSLGIKVCPYCNRQYITSYTVADGKKDKVLTTTDTDHYYPKSYFPLLSMNIHNMVPSCQICNSRMKLNKVTCREECHLYPYKDTSDSLKFEVQFNDLEELYNFSENDIKILLKESLKKGVKNRAGQSKTIFKLEEVYAAHKDVVFNLKNNMSRYSSDGYEKIFCENYTDIYGGYDEFLKVLYPFLAEDEKEVPLAKMKKDIYYFIKNETD